MKWYVYTIIILTLFTILISTNTLIPLIMLIYNHPISTIVIIGLGIIIGFWVKLQLYEPDNLEDESVEQFKI